MRILVTGGAGFIGSHVVDAFVEQGHEVFVVDDLSSGSRRNLRAGVELLEADFGSEAALDLLNRKRIEVIDHHAAQIDVRRSVADPAFDAGINVVGSLRLLQRAVEVGVRKVIFASSGGAIYGEPVFAPQTEEHPYRPISPYGCAKLALEHYLEYYGVVHRLPSVRLRYGNVYGPRQNSGGEAGVVAIFASRLLAGEPLVINGDGEQTRDFVFVEDVVRANVAALEDAVDGSFNVGTGVETSISRLAAELKEIARSDVPVEHAAAKLGEQRRSVIDGNRLRSLLGLRRPLPLRVGLERTWHWFESEARPG